MFSVRDRGMLINEFAALMLTGGLEVRTELDREYDGGHGTAARAARAAAIVLGAGGQYEAGRILNNVAKVSCYRMCDRIE
jgi:hypothetical protein